MTNERVTASSQKFIPASDIRMPKVVQDALTSAGKPLDVETRVYMEPHFGHDFGHVRVHDDSLAAESARAVNALAYTVGHNIAFGKGQYTPATVHGQRLLAHELAHVVQQMDCPPSTFIGFDNAHEQAAESASTAIMAGRPVSVTQAPGLGLARQARSFSAVKKDILEELNRNMPVAILGMLDGLDQKTRDALNADSEINQAIAMLPPEARSIVMRHLLAGQKIDETQASTALPVTRARFEKIMKDRYRVKTIRDGTFQNQAFGNMKESDWKTWPAEPSSPIYGLIIEAFVNVEKTFGGLPPVNEIVFFDAEYHRDDKGDPIKDTDTGASYQNGLMIIYSAVQMGNRMFNMQGVLEKPDMETSVRRNITHELGHGIGETAMNQGTNEPPGADPDLFREYPPAVGWAKDGQLYDIQEKAVQDALKKDIQPPAEFHIVPDNVYTKPWKERPLTKYMATNVMEDFAEAIMAYVNEPERLKTYCPARYTFIENHKPRWLASAHPRKNIWEEAKQYGPARVLKPSRSPNIWDRVREGKD